ncbi:unnamed protein product [Notodromas monacha]|uniref:Uncharacterized protein n=1 Tax=Notodromas monacha TaxID=399045 RepID=A0A7R9BKZ8_9CRUS|nr:unnamed protein product [Notodromas monacha]CAG0916106.1 unnamed protein product [Notodromas monacha]
MTLRVRRDACRVPMNCGHDEVLGVIYSVEYTRRGLKKLILRKLLSSERKGRPLSLSDMVADMGRTSRLDVTGNDGSKGAMGEEVAVGRVESWAMSFERLLRDTAGIHTFAEFLKKEFSHENIYFWVAVQRYKLMFDKETSDGEENITDKEKEERISAAREIYERHLSLSASEPVNVDSQARQFVQDNITRADAKIFAKAEQQIFNLMKYDSYARFLKSPLYKDAAKAENEGRELPFPGGDQVEADLRLEPSTDGRNESTIQKNVGRRKSLLGWGKRSRAKSRESRPRSRTRAPRASSLRRLRPKDQKTSEASESSGQPKTMLPNSTSIRDGSVQSNGSRLSLASSDLALMSRNFSTSQESLPSEKEALANVSCMSVSSAGKENYNGPLCRMILPDQSTTVVPLMPGETIHALVFRLLGKKGLSYSATDVYTINSGVPIDQSKDSLVLSCHEVRVERRVLINFVLPWDKSVPVKAGPGRKLCEVLRPVLNSHNQELQRWQQQHGKTSSRYAYPALKVDHFTAHRGSDETSLSMKTLATNLDNETVVLKFKEGPSNNTLTGKGLLGAKKLDEITNRVFLDLMRSKSVTDADKVPTDDSSSQSSGIVGSLLRRNSIHVDRDFSEKGLSVAASDPDAVLAPPRLFLDDGVGDQPSPSREELYAELKRADKLRLDDQRGLKLNCEIPDFLMGSSGGSGVTDDKENETKSRIVKVDEKDFMRASTKGAFKTSRIEISASSSSIYGDPSSSFETKYDPRKDASALSRLCSDPSDVDFYPFCTDDQSYLNSRNESVGKNAGSSKPTSRLSSQLTPPPLPPKPKVFRAPAFLRPPPPPPPLRREAMDALDYIAPPRPRTVRRSDRLNQTHAFERSGGAGNPLPSISFV